MIEISKIEKDWDMRGVEYLRFATPKWEIIIYPDSRNVSVSILVGEVTTIFDCVDINDDSLKEVSLSTDGLPPRQVNDLADNILYLWWNNV